MNTMHRVAATCALTSLMAALPAKADDERNIVGMVSLKSAFGPTGIQGGGALTSKHPGKGREATFMVATSPNKDSSGNNYVNLITSEGILSADPHTGRVTTNCKKAGPWEEIRVSNGIGKTVAFQYVASGHWLTAEPDGRVVADRDVIGPWQLFEVGVPDVSPASFVLESPALFLTQFRDGRYVLPKDIDRDLMDPRRTTGGQIGLSIGIVAGTIYGGPAVGVTAGAAGMLVGHGLDRTCTRLCNDITGPAWAKFEVACNERWKDLEHGPGGVIVGKIAATVAQGVNTVGDIIADVFGW